MNIDSSWEITDLCQLLNPCTVSSLLPCSSPCSRLFTPTLHSPRMTLPSLLSCVWLNSAAPAFDMVTACMQYTAETESKNKSRASKAHSEARKIAAEYSEKTKAVIMEEQKEMCVFLFPSPQEQYADQRHVLVKLFMMNIARKHRKTCLKRIKS